MGHQLPSKQCIEDAITRGDIRVTRDHTHSLTGIYCTKDIASLFSPMFVQTSQIRPETREKSLYDLGMMHWQLSTSDFYMEYGDVIYMEYGDVILEKAQAIDKKPRSQALDSLLPFP